ncbi:DUF4062 domain-containing protein [Fodinibius sp. SL11]|uniref:DUF4062 domain-containing protein n=1 Tax=Fodinibius sp. SL11 TaxID=3425690 RepID=UPI003F8839A1
MKKTVFISSTYLDLKDYRSEVWELLNSNYDVDIKGMEDFGARTESPLETCLSEVDQSDIYVGLVGVRLGSINEDKGKSYTQLEYERAVEKGKEILIYLIDEENAKVSPNLVDKENKHVKLKSFKDKLKKSHTVDFFVNENDLVKKLERKFDELLEIKTESHELKDEIQFSKKVIDEFFLFPKSRSGQEIKLRVKFDSNYYPASKDICNSFNKNYGSTVIMNLEVRAPENGNKLDKILVNHEQFKKVKDIIGKEIDIYTNLLFTENTINKFRAYFVREEKGYSSLMTTIAVNPLMQKEVNEREGTLILSLNEVI